MVLKWCAKSIFFLFPTSYSMKQFDHSLHSIQGMLNPSHNIINMPDISAQTCQSLSLLYQD